MWWIFGKIVSFFGGNFAKNVIQDVINTINTANIEETKRQELITEAMMKYIDAQVQLGATRAGVWGKWSGFFAAAFLLGPAIWWNAVFLVSVFPQWFGQYHVLALPADFYPWMATIIGAVFFSPVVSNTIGKIGLPTLQSKRYTSSN